MRRMPAACACILMFTSAIASASTEKPQTVDYVNLDKYAGKWYEIARLPNSFQDQCVSEVTAEYRRRDDGGLEVINRCRMEDGSMDQARGAARVVNEETNAKLKVRFAPAWLSWLPATWVDFWILYRAPDYSVSAVGTPTRKSLWILSRTPDLPEEVYKEMTRHLAKQGYAVDKLMPTAQQANTQQGH
jgi:apolipoprotein D and lipocalin family protein